MKSRKSPLILEGSRHPDHVEHLCPEKSLGSGRSVQTPSEPSPCRSVRLSAEHRCPGPPGTLVPGGQGPCPSLFALLPALNVMPTCLVTKRGLGLSRRPGPRLRDLQGPGAGPAPGEARARTARPGLGFPSVLRSVRGGQGALGPMGGLLRSAYFPL